AIPEYLAKLGHPRGHLFVSRNRDSNNISQVQPSRSALEDRLVARKNLSAAHASIACRLAVPFPEEPGMIFHYPGADSGLEREPLGCCHQEPRDVSLPKLPCDRCRMRPQRAFELPRGPCLIDSKRDRAVPNPALFLCIYIKELKIGVVSVKV